MTRAAARGRLPDLHPRHRRSRQPRRDGRLRARRRARCREPAPCGSATSTRRSSTRRRFRASRRSTSSPRCSRRTRRRTCRGCRRASARRGRPRAPTSGGSCVEAGARLASGSDFPVEEPNPMLGFYAAITRQAPDGQPPEGWAPDQRLTRDEALRSFTLDAAYAAHAGDAERVARGRQARRPRPAVPRHHAGAAARHPDHHGRPDRLRRPGDARYPHGGSRPLAASLRDPHARHRRSGRSRRRSRR